MSLELISIELTNRCVKGCWFCYNHSGPEGVTYWTPDELVAFVTDCAAHGIKAVTFGGGEPLQYDGLFEVLHRLRGVLYRTLTSNGLLLTSEKLEQLIQAAPDKVHLSIHFPERAAEVERVVRQVQELAGSANFQSMRCLLGCARSPRRLRELTFAGLQAATEGLGLEFCGGT
jgi:molybdenum cofactor biosynthesis enzyme MoaA